MLTRREIERAGPIKALLINAGYHTTMFSLEADVVRDVRRALYLSGAACCSCC